MNISLVVPSIDTATDTMTDFEKMDRVRRSSADTCLFIHAIVLIRYFPYWKLLFLSFIFKQLLLRNCAVNFVEICNVYIGKMIIKAAKRIFNSGKICRSYSDLNFGVTFLEHSVERYSHQTSGAQKSKYIKMHLRTGLRPDPARTPLREITVIPQIS